MITATDLFSFFYGENVPKTRGVALSSLDGSVFAVKADLLDGGFFVFHGVGLFFSYSLYYTIFFLFVNLYACCAKKQSKAAAKPQANLTGR